MRAWWTLLRAEWDRVVGWSLVALGALLVLLGFRGVADSPFVSDQLAYIASGGIGGILLAVVGVGLLVSADLHDEWRKLDRIEQVMRDVPRTDGLQETAGHGGDGHTGSPSSESRVVPGRLQVPGVPIFTVAVVPVALGWQQAAATTELDTALGGAGLGLGGLIIAGFGLALVLTRIRARLAARKSTLFGDLLLTAMVSDRRRRLGPSVVSCAPPGEVLVAGGLERYHRPGCPALRGVEAQSVALGCVDPSLRPCGLCDADGLGGAGGSQ